MGEAGLIGGQNLVSGHPFGSYSWGASEELNERGGRGELVSTSHHDWAWLAALWARLGEIPDTNPVPKLRRYLTAMTERLEASQGWATLGARIGDPEDPAGGWRAVDIFPRFALEETSDIDFVRAYASSADNLWKDEGTKRVLEAAGRPRAVLRRELFLDGAPGEAPSAELMAQMNSADMLIAAQPVSDDAELFFTYDRPPDTPPFEPAHCNLVLRSMLGITWLSLSIALWYGLLGPGPPLTRREREVLVQLLDGLSEGEIATHLGIGHRTVHQHVVAIYRKLGVNSRTELMAIWIRRGAREPADAGDHVALGLSVRSKSR